MIIDKLKKNRDHKPKTSIIDAYIEELFFFSQNSPTWLGEYATGFKIDDLILTYCLKKNQKSGQNQFFEDRFNRSSIN